DMAEEGETSANVPALPPCPPTLPVHHSLTHKPGQNAAKPDGKEFIIFPECCFCLSTVFPSTKKTCICTLLL
ncbi:hypothetical protein DKP78_24515, partial [Enterococcus faecium]